MANTNNAMTELYYNEVVKHLSIRWKNQCDYGFIKCSFRFGRFYIDYEVIDKCDLTHMSVTKSYRPDGSMRENYSRVNTKYGFLDSDDKETFDSIEAKLISFIKQFNN